jgi:hypothetical protein
LKGNLKFMAMKWNSTVNRHQCELTGTKSAREFRELHHPTFGVRRQSEAATALFFVQSRPVTSKRRSASLAAALHIFRDGCFWCQNVPSPSGRSFEILTTQGTRRIVWKFAAYENLD